MAGPIARRPLVPILGAPSPAFATGDHAARLKIGIGGHGTDPLLLGRAVKRELVGQLERPELLDQ